MTEVLHRMVYTGNTATLLAVTMALSILVAGCCTGSPGARLVSRRSGFDARLRQRCARAATKPVASARETGSSQVAPVSSVTKTQTGAC